MKKRGRGLFALMRKKGLSTVVITLIIILISLVAVGIVWVVVRNVIQTGTKEVTLGQFTLDAKILNVNTDNSSNNVSLTVKRNAGAGEFTKMNFVFSDGRNTEVITQPFSLNELEQKSFMFHLNILNVNNLISISIVPYIKQDEKEILGTVLDKYTISGPGIQLICAPATCASLGYECGTNWANGTNCAGTLNCDTPNCTISHGSGYNCVSGICVFGGSCSPYTCASQGYQCGTPVNGTCSGNLNCGPLTCDAYGTGYTCTGSPNYKCVDTTAPVLSNAAPTGVLPAGTTQTTISLNTNENATCRYSLGAGTPYGSMRTFSTTGLKAHSNLTTGLVDGGNYNYYVKCNDSVGNINPSDSTISFSVASSGGVLCEANTYYVDFASGSDSNNGTCSNSAWKHAPGDGNAAGIPASVVIQTGKKILFKGGVVYVGGIQITSSRYQNGNVTDNIILRSGDRDPSAWGTGRAVINGNYTVLRGFYINTRSFITIDGFEIMNMSGADGAGVYFEYGASSNIHILNNLIHHIYGGGSSSNGYGIETGGLNNNLLIEFNEVYFVRAKAIELWATSNSIIRYNYVHQTQDHNIVVSGVNNSIYDNLMSQAGYNWGDGAPYVPAYSFKLDSGNTSGYSYADNNNIYNNIIWNTTTGLGVINGKYNNFYNNIVYYVGFGSLYDGGGGGNIGFFLFKDGRTSSNTVTGNNITNNIFYYVNLYNDGPGIGSAGFFWRNFSGNSEIINNTVKNNLFYYDSSYINLFRDPTFTYHNISWFQGPSGFASIAGGGNVASGNIALNPNLSGGSGASILSSVPTWFDAQGHPNNTGFMLTASSPARDAGLALGSPFNVDVNGISRPQGAAWDIGAYEYV